MEHVIRKIRIGYPDQPDHQKYCSAQQMRKIEYYPVSKSSKKHTSYRVSLKKKISLSMKTPDGSVCIIEAYSFLPPPSHRVLIFFFGKNKKYILYHLLGKMTTIFPACEIMSAEKNRMPL